MSRLSRKAVASANTYSGPLIFGPEQARRFLELADTVKQIVEAQNGRLAVFFAFLKPPQSPVAVPTGLVFYDGPIEKAKELVKPLYDLGPVADMLRTVPYAAATAPSALTNGPPTHQRYATSNFQVCC